MSLVVYGDDSVHCLGSDDSFVGPQGPLRAIKQGTFEGTPHNSEWGNGTFGVPRGSDRADRNCNVPLVVFVDDSVHVMGSGDPLAGLVV